MPFVKLDCGILRSTLWMDRDAREVFITALLMAEPVEYSEPLPEIATRSLDYTGWVAPPGWYGFVPAANVGIIHAAMIEREAGMAALEKLAAPDTEDGWGDIDLPLAADWPRRPLQKVDAETGRPSRTRHATPERT